jgi:hypothetical protein
MYSPLKLPIVIQRNRIRLWALWVMPLAYLPYCIVQAKPLLASDQGFLAKLLGIGYLSPLVAISAIIIVFLCSKNPGLVIKHDGLESDVWPAKFQVKWINVKEIKHTTRLGKQVLEIVMRDGYEVTAENDYIQQWLKGSTVFEHGRRLPLVYYRYDMPRKELRALVEQVFAATKPVTGQTPREWWFT